VAERIVKLMEQSSVYRLRRRVQQAYTWRAIFERDIRPMLGEEWR